MSKRYEATHWLALGSLLAACGSNSDGGDSNTDGSVGGSFEAGTTSDGGGGSDGSASDSGNQPGTDSGLDGGTPTGSVDGGGVTSACRAPQPKANPSVGNSCRNSAPPAIKLTPVARGLSLPVYVTQAPNDKSRMYVVEQRGLIKVISNGQVEATPFLDITSKVVQDPGIAGEQGLLGIAFDPNYQTTGRFWVKYSKEQSSLGDDTVAQYTATPGGTADAASEKVLAEISAPHPNRLRNHNGGMLAFGPDGCLYIAFGDGGGSGDPAGNGQRRSDIFADILRIDVDKFPTPAPGNITGQDVNPHLWNYGLRNPWRFSFDRANGDLYIGDVGQDAWEEVDVEPAGTGGRNYGWNVVEGKGHCYNAATCDQSGKTPPAVEYANPAGTGQASVIGGYVYRGSAMPTMVGRYLYADSYSRKIKSFTYSGETAGAPTVCDEYPLNIDAPSNPYSFGEDLDGELYLTTADGNVFKFEPG